MDATEKLYVVCAVSLLVGYLLGRKRTGCTCQAQAAQQEADPLAWLNSWTG